jgi:hypothetical protein
MKIVKRQKLDIEIKELNLGFYLLYLERRLQFLKALIALSQNKSQS